MFIFSACLNVDFRKILKFFCAFWQKNMMLVSYSKKNFVTICQEIQKMVDPDKCFISCVFLFYSNNENELSRNTEKFFSFSKISHLFLISHLFKKKTYPLPFFKNMSKRNNPVVSPSSEKKRKVMQEQTTKASSSSVSHSQSSAEVSHKG